jgi:hypothetical protein
MSKTRFAFFAGTGGRRSSGVQESFERLKTCQAPKNRYAAADKAERPGGGAAKQIMRALREFELSGCR